MVNAQIINNKIETTRSRVVLAIVFYTLVAILLTHHVIIYLTANTFIDSDQFFMWAGVKDYSEGRFYEPRFYGQDYNTFLEALVAVPLYKMGMPVYLALPLATHLLFLTPLLFLVFYLFRSGREIHAIICLSVFCCLTTAFDIMTSIPRGFVTGIFFSTFFVLSYIHPNNLKYLGLNLIMGVIGMFVNPNIIVTAFPLGFWLLFHHYRNPRFYLVVLAGLVTAAILYFLFDWFYARHPDYIILTIIHSYSLDYFIQNITNLDECFTHVSFFVEENSLPLLAGLAILGSLLFFQNKRGFYIFAAFILFLTATLIVGKTREGTHWPFYSYSRMYLGLPFALCGFITMLRVQKDTIFFLIILVTFSFSVYKLVMAKRVIAYHTFHMRAAVVRISPLKDVMDVITLYGDRCRTYDAEKLIVSTIFWMSTGLVYGASAVDPEFVPAQETSVDRRYWVREFEKDSVYKRFILLSVNYNFDKMVGSKFPFKIQRLDDWGLYLVTDNKMPNQQFINLVRYCER